MDGYITRESLGRMAQVGYLYDARSDTFLSSCLRSTPPEKSITVMDSPHSDIKYISSKSLADKLDKLNVKAELKLSVLAGLITLEGSGEYLKEEKRSAKTASASLIYSIRTKTEDFNLFFDGVKESISTSAIETTSATHIVTKIDWGANCIVEVQSHTDSVDNVLKAEGKLQAQLKKGFEKIAACVGGDADATFQSDAKEETDNFTLRVFGDVLPDNEELPQKFHDALALMKKLPSLVKQANNGKGKPLTYQLFSLASVQKIMQLDSVMDRTLYNISAASIQKLLSLFQEIQAQKQDLYDLSEEAKRKKKYFLQTELNNIFDHKSGLEMEEIAFREKLANALKAVRSGRKDCSSLDELSIELLESKYGPRNVEKFIDSCSDVFQKVIFVETLIGKGMRYLTVNDFYDFTAEEDSAFIYYFGSRCRTNPVEWSRQKRLAQVLLAVKEAGVGCAMVDFDLMPKEASGSINSCCIQVYKDGSLQETINDASQMKKLGEKQVSVARSEELESATEEEFNAVQCPACEQSFSSGATMEDTVKNLVQTVQNVQRKSENSERILNNIYLSERSLPRLRETSKMLKLVQTIKDSRHLNDDRLEAAMLAVDRGCFCSNNPYSEAAQSIGFDTTISAPHMHAILLTHLKDKLIEGASALDVGSGSGYLTACMGFLVGNSGISIGIDIVPELVEFGRSNVQKLSPLLQLQNVSFVFGDGKNGYPEKAPYDVINIGGTVKNVPEALLQQLKDGGKLIAPVSEGSVTQLKLYTKTAHGNQVENLMKVSFGQLR